MIDAKYHGLLREANNADAAVRHEAVRQLSQLGYPDLNDVLADKLNDPSPAVRALVISTLARGEQEIFLDTAVIFLGDRDPLVQQVAARLLLAVIDQPMTRVTLAAQSHNPNRLIQTNVLRLLGHVKEPSVVETLLRKLSSPDSRIRVACTEALGHSCDPATVDALMTRLTDKSPAVRASAARSLGHLGDPCASQSLIELLSEESEPSVRSAAIDALGKLGDERSVSLLLELLLSDHEDHEMKNIVATALSYLNAAGRHALEMASKSADTFTRDLAVNTLEWADGRQM